MSDEHLHNAARTLERVLAAKHPGVTFTATIRKHERGDGVSDLSRVRTVNQPGTVTDHTHPIREQSARPTPTTTLDDHNLKQAS